jgi:hypothetical protein
MRVESATFFQPKLEPTVSCRLALRESRTRGGRAHGGAARIVSIGLRIRQIQEQGLRQYIRQISFRFPFSRMRDLWLIPMLSSQYRVQALSQ